MFYAYKPPITRSRAQKVLSTKMNYREYGILTRGEFVEKSARKGATWNFSKIQHRDTEKFHWFVDNTEATKIGVDYLCYLSGQPAPETPRVEKKKDPYSGYVFHSIAKGA